MPHPSSLVRDALFAGAIVACAAVSPLKAQTATSDQAPGERPSLAATIAAMPKNLARAEAPDLTAAVAAAQAAHRACTARNVKVSVLIADVLGKPVVLLSGDGAGVRSQLIAQTKANIVVRYGKSSGEVAEEAKTNPRLTAEAAADPDIGVLRGGAYPVRRDGRTIGIVAVSGGSLGGVMGLDELCAMVAVTALEAR
jgi:uncharacterized protein GlcG (DUF336 family)